MPKTSKRNVRYRPANPLRPGRRCGTCAMYRAPDPGLWGGLCTLVAGQIAPAAVCDRYAPKVDGRDTK